MAVTHIPSIARHARTNAGSAADHDISNGAHVNMTCNVQEIVRPDVFWYEAALKSPMPFGNSPAAILGLVAFELFAMHYVEVRRAYDLKNPGSVDQDPIFKNYRYSQSWPQVTYMSISLE